MNNHCYNLKEISFSNGCFDGCIDVTYVLMCCGSNPKRYDNVMKELWKLKPSKKIKLLYNEGFKNCQKNIIKQQTNYDLLDALMYVFNDAKEFNKILVLEDDFETDEKIHQDGHVNSITKFLNKENPDIYGLGNVCVIHPLYIFRKHQRCLFMLTAHAIFYSKYYRSVMLQNYTHCTHKLHQISPHVDVNFNFKGFKLYRYNTQLSYQLHNETENFKNWDIFGIKNEAFFKFLIRLHGTDKDPRLGYDRVNITNHCISLIIMVIIILIIYKLIK